MPFLFNATIRENIRLGRAGASDNDVERAAAQAMIHDFIMTLPDRYDTILVMVNGRIVERGNHSDLLSQNGVYARLVAAQRDVIVQ